MGMIHSVAHLQSQAISDADKASILSGRAETLLKVS
jgi:hypothetical protein